MGCNDSCQDLTRGRQGDAGISSLTFYAWASDVNGTNFSLVPDPVNLQFEQKITLNSVPTSPLTLSNFPLPFYRYVGTSGTNGTNGTTILYSNVNTTTCTTGSSNDILDTYTLPANSLAVDGDYIEISGIIKGQGGSGTNICYPYISFGGNDLLALSGIVPTGGTVANFTARVYRVSSVRYKYDITMQIMVLPNSSNWIFASLAGISTAFSSSQVINFGVRKNGQSQTSGDFNLVNFHINQFKQ